MTNVKEIRKYWDERAMNGDSATTDDIHLRELEVFSINQVIKEIEIGSGRLLDIGCGDGDSTLKIAVAAPKARCLGIDYSENMIQVAKERLDVQPELKDRVSFALGDVIDLRPIPSDFDIVLSDRCLINLGSVKSQSDAIAQIAGHVKHGGYFVAIENFIEGHDNLNKARKAVGLPELPVRWHNLYFRENEFVRIVRRFFDVLDILEFSSAYYYATRVIYSKMCQMRGEKPDYRHEIHQLAVNLPTIGQFSPIKMVVLRRNGQDV